MNLLRIIIIILLFNSVAHAEGNFFALGLSPAWNFRSEYSNRLFRKFNTEISAHVFTEINNNFDITFNNNLAFGWEQPDFPQSISINEKDLWEIVSAGIVYRGVLFPNINCGGGVLVRFLRLVTAEPIKLTDDKISGTKYLPLGMCQLGVGIPIGNGRFLLEPWFRLLWVPTDARQKATAGIEFSISLP